MPLSKKRPHHHHEQQHHHEHSNPKEGAKSGRLINAGVIFFAILGLLGSYFIAGSDIIWLVAGTVGGAAIGYFFAKQMSKTFSK